MMSKTVKKILKSNLVFQGGGVLGVAYLGAIDYLAEIGVLQKIVKVAGVSAGAITACVTSFNLPFDETKKISDSLEFEKVLDKRDVAEVGKFSNSIKMEVEDLFGDIHCLHRLMNNYGFYSTDYFYNWMCEVIKDQFDQQKKLPPYTFADFKNASIHKEERQFKDLYVKGTDISMKESRLFSYETTPNLEVAEAVKISMSIPLYFEATKRIIPEETDNPTDINIYEGQRFFSDGGIMANYPINIFDGKKVNFQTLGVRISSETVYKKISNLLEYIVGLMEAFMSVQNDYYNNNSVDKARTIEIKTGQMSPMKFNMKTGDETYNFLYQQGYNAAKAFFR